MLAELINVPSKFEEEEDNEDDKDILSTGGDGWKQNPS